MWLPFKRKRRKSPLLQTVEEMDGKLDALINQVSALASRGPVAPHGAIVDTEEGIEPFTEFEPFTAEDQA